MSLTKQDLDYNQDGDPAGFDVERGYPAPHYPAGFARGLDDWDLERVMAEHAKKYGDEALAQKVDRFMRERNLW